MNFKNRQAYDKWLAFGHMHGKFHGRQPVTIGGKRHHVVHTKKKKSWSDKL